VKKVIIYRFDQSDQGSIGILFTPGFLCYSMELPWRDNERSFSCIPKGTYIAKIRKSRKYGITFHVTDVEGRSYILIHAGNWAGDTKKGYKAHSEGCILFGKRTGLLQGQKAVLYSKPTIKKFMKHVCNEPFELEIIGGQ
jgi:hypothetical protein